MFRNEEVNPYRIYELYPRIECGGAAFNIIERENKCSVKENGS